MARSPLTESNRKVRRILEEIRDTLTEDEHNLLLDELLPEPEPAKKPQKKPGKKGAGKGASKSARASGMAAAISNSLESSRKATVATDDDGGSSDVRCQFIRLDGDRCHLLPDHNIHHLATANEFHEFQPPRQAQVAVGSGD